MEFEALWVESLKDSGQSLITQIILVESQLDEPFTLSVLLFQSLTQSFDQSTYHLISKDLQFFILDTGLLWKSYQLTIRVRLEEIFINGVTFSFLFMLRSGSRHWIAP